MNKKSGEPIRGLLRLRENPIERLSIMCFSCPLWLDRTINAGPLKSRFRERSFPDRGSAVDRERAPSASRYWRNSMRGRCSLWRPRAPAAPSFRIAGATVGHNCGRPQHVRAPCRIISAPGRNHGALNALVVSQASRDSKIEYRLLAKHRWSL